MNTYKIMLEIVSDTAPDWIIPAIEEQLEEGERVKYFDYTMHDTKEITAEQFIKEHFQFITIK